MKCPVCGSAETVHALEQKLRDLQARTQPRFVQGTLFDLADHLPVASLKPEAEMCANCGVVYSDTNRVTALRLAITEAQLKAGLIMDAIGGLSE